MEENKFEQLKVWQKAHEVTIKIYKILRAFPREEMYALTNQLRRACVSIPANIVEGYGRKTTKEMIQFFHIARGSLEETKYFIILSKDLEYIDSEKYKDIMQHLQEVGRMLNGFIKSKSKVEINR